LIIYWTNSGGGGGDENRNETNGYKRNIHLFFPHLLLDNWGIKL